MDATPSKVDAGGFGVLGAVCRTPERYDPSILFPVPRDRGRMPLGLAGAPPPFEGEDVWNAYELSWLSRNGVPRRHVLEMRMPCDSPNIVESKSLKLYLNSLNHKRFESADQLLVTIRSDLKTVLGGWWMGVDIALHEHDHPGSVCARVPPLSSFECIDATLDDEELDADVLDTPDASHVRLAMGAAEEEPVRERLVTHQLRTLCPVAHQPDWGSVYIEYEGPRLDRGSILKFVVSLRKAVSLHEATIERIWLALREGGQPTELRVTGRFMRRGGIDINPTRELRKPVTTTPAPFQRSSD